MTSQSDIDAIVARAAKIQSVGGSLLSNATALKKAALALTPDAPPVDPPADPPPVVDPPVVDPPVTPPPTGTGTLPTEATVGATGTLTKRAGDTLSAGTYENIEFTGEIKIYDRGVTLRNVKAPSIVMYGPGGYTLDRVTAGGIYVDAYYNDIDGVTMTGIRVKATDGDGIDIFSNHKISNVTIDGLIADGFTFPSGSGDHGDGIQVRGCTNLTIRNAIIDMGPYQPQKNAALYMEDVADGLRNVTVENVRLAGGGYTFYVATASSPSVVRDVQITASGEWGPVQITGTKANWTFDNVTGPNGKPLTP